VAEAQAQGAKTLISAGAMQSNHCRQTAAAAAKFGMECILVLNGQHPDQPSANLMLDFLFNADVVWVPDRKDRDAVLQHTYETALANDCRPYLVPYGGSSPTGALGYAFAVQELMGQGLKPDWIIFATSSGGTHAGLTLGARMFKCEARILGISIDEPVRALKANVSALARDASEKFGRRINFSGEDVLANDEYCQAGYGVFGGQEHEAIDLFARYEGLLLDPVYTGRAAAGMIDLIRRGIIQKNETVLFWHTGGQPALFAEKYQPDIL
jgi:D-cysteine desulfhydrase